MVARFIKKNSRSFTTLAALLLIVLVFSILSPRYFKYDNLIDIVNQGVVNGFLAIGITVAIITPASIFRSDLPWQLSLSDALSFPLTRFR